MAAPCLVGGLWRQTSFQLTCRTLNLGLNAKPKLLQYYTPSPKCEALQYSYYCSYPAFSLTKYGKQSPSSVLCLSLPEGNPLHARLSSSSAPVEKKDRIVTIPNLLCVSRIAAAPYIAYCIASADWATAAGLFVYAGATDLADGAIARRFPSQASSVGSFLDPLSDKILVGVVFLALTYAGQIPASLTGLIVSRDLFLVYAGLYIRYMSVVPPFTWAKYFDPTLPTATIQPTTISKVNTALQFLLVAVSLGAPILHYQGHPSLHYLWAATGATTFLSAVSYAFMKDTYKFSHKEYDHQFGKKLFAFVLFILLNIGFTLTFPAKPMVKSGADCPITGGPDPYSEPTNQYYLKMIRNRKKDEE